MTGQMAGMMQDKVALVTGAGSGIGRASALLFAREGARVLLADIDTHGGEQTRAAIEEAGGVAHFLRTDVTDEAQVEALVARAVERFGRLDCAHNNAGISGPTALLHGIERADWDRTLAVNLTGIFLCMKHEIHQMLEQGEGAIVNTSSGAGLVATPGMATYCASKHAILGLTKTAAVETAGSGVRVNAVCPGSTDTPMLRSMMALDPSIEKMILSSVPTGRLGEPHEVAEAVVWLCSDRAAFVSGDSLLVDGGSVAR